MAEWEPIQIAYEVFEPALISNKKLAPMIFLHELLCSKETWDKIPQRVANETGRKVYTYDARNHGDSEYTNAASFHFNVYDLFKFMDEMKVKKAVLVGHGMGGMTAITAAIEMPYRIEKVFIIDMYVRRLQKNITEGLIFFMTLWAEVIQNLSDETPLEEVTSTSMETLFEILPQNLISAPERDAWMKLKLVYKKLPDGRYDVNFNTEALSQAIRQYRFWPRERNRQYSETAYFIYGSFSSYNVDSEATNIKKHFPKAQLIQFKGASHHLMVDYPDKFVHTLVNKLNL